MSSLENARKNLGELLISGITGTSLSEASRSFFKSKSIGGVILFKHNYESPEQVAGFIGQIQETKKDLPLWVSVDHEGGRVQRFKSPFTELPSAMTLAKKDSAKLIFELSQAVAAELKVVGINLDYTPVADILTNPANPVIGDRAWGTTEETVSKFVSAVVRGFLAGGVAPCSKHFPGHGDTTLDSHFALPRVDTPLETLVAREFQPFKKSFKSGCPFVMTAHVLATALDPELPSTFSKKTLTEYLRQECRFEGVIISDDLEMKAITDHYGEDEAPVLAIEAGCDLLIYRTQAAAQKAFDALDRALTTGKLSPSRVLESALRSQNIKKDLLLPYQKPDVTRVLSFLKASKAQEILKQLL